MSKRQLIPDYDEIAAFLEHDLPKNMNMIYFMEDNHIHSLERTGDSVLMRGDSDHRWVYISSPDEKELATVASHLGAEDRYLAIIEDWMIPTITGHRDIVWQLTTMKMVLAPEVRLPQTAVHHISPLSVDDAYTIMANSHYGAFTSAAYLQERINRGPSGGIRMDGKLVAWILTHDDGAIGTLHVLDDFRRQGFALDLLRFLSQEVRDAGRLPFAQIEEDNVKSLNLVSKLGYTKDRRVHWFKVE